jgi:uncharacterized membrane protein YcgQ (UPF0703/DUF1980 family)
MKFKIVKRKKNDKERFEAFYFNELDNRGPKWSQVIWDKQRYLNLMDGNYTDTMEEVEQKVREFMEEYKQEHGAVVKEFELN